LTPPTLIRHQQQALPQLPDFLNFTPGTNLAPPTGLFRSRN